MINAASAITTLQPAAKSSDATRATLDYNAFLQLLMAQLKSQDPTEPVDQSQTLAQLASFSNVEQSIKLNDKLNMLIQQMGVGQSAQLIGHRIESLEDGTSGRVASVEMKNSEITLVLENGERVGMSEGIRIT